MTTLNTGVYYFSCVNIGTGGVVTISGAVTIFTECFTLNAGATITGIGTGYPGNSLYWLNTPPYSGPGEGGENWIGSPYLSAGGGHGGAGQTVCDAGYCLYCQGNANGGVTNDDPVHPSLMGSGGGVIDNFKGVVGYQALNQSAGGGLLHVVVFNPSTNSLGAATVNGTIDMSGNMGCQACGPEAESGGGGAGGTIWLEASTLSGTGLLQANGGGDNYGNWGGGGGGGIISLITNSTSFPGTTSVVSLGGEGEGFSTCGFGGQGSVTFTAPPASGY